MKSSASKLSAAFESLLADLGSDASRRGYRSDWKFYLKWLRAKKLDAFKVGPKDVKRYLAHLTEKGQAHRTRGRALSVIRAIYGAFVVEGLLSVNPAREVKDTRRGKVGEKVTWLEEDALAKFLAFGRPYRSADDFDVTDDLEDAPDGVSVELDDGSTYERRGDRWHRKEPSWLDRRDRMCVQLLAGTGRRRSEVARMRVEDFSDDGVTGIVKGGAEKIAPVPDWLRRELAEWSAFAKIERGAVLPRSPDDPSAVCGDTVYSIVKCVAVAVGIDPKKIAPHGIRRTLATLSERRGAPLADIQTQLGHRSIQTTEIYLKGSRKVETAPGEWMGALVGAGRAL